MPIISNFPSGSVNPSDLTNYEVTVTENTSGDVEYVKVYTISQGGTVIATLNLLSEDALNGIRWAIDEDDGGLNIICDES